MKKIKYVFFCLLAVAVAVAGIRLYPAAKAALILYEAAGLEGCEYSALAVLNKENLSMEEWNLLESVSWLLGVDGEDMLSLRAEGHLCRGVLYARIYCGGMDTPVTEIYSSQQTDVCNVEMLYDTIHTRLVEKYPLLGVILPQWKYEKYMTIEQMEKIFALDLSQVKELRNILPDKKQLFLKGVLALIAMEGKTVSGGNLEFNKNFGTAEILLQVGKQGGVPRIAIRSNFSGQDQKIRECAGSMDFQNMEEIVMPDSVMKPDAADQFASLWALLTQLRGKLNEILGK